MYSLSNKDIANSRPIFQFIDFIGFFIYLWWKVLDV